VEVVEDYRRQVVHRYQVPGNIPRNREDKAEEDRHSDHYVPNPKSFR
jgi:hypothetical protein